jgi:8-amino-7-oxononanoate synthase
MANIGVFSALRDELDWVLQDKLNHASLIDANHLIGLPLIFGCLASDR